MTTYTDGLVHSLHHAGQLHIITYLKSLLETFYYYTLCVFTVYQNHPTKVQMFKRSKLGHAFAA